MHVRLSAVLGMPITTDDLPEMIGMLSGILLHPDTGIVEGFFVAATAGDDLFLSSLDIVRWTNRIVIRSTDVLGPVGDRIRLQPLLQEGRTILGQRVQTESGIRLGRVKDVQFDTVHFQCEWIFPKRILGWGMPIPLSQILEVRTDVVLVRDQTASEEEKEDRTPSIISAMPEAA